MQRESAGFHRFFCKDTDADGAGRTGPAIRPTHGFVQTNSSYSNLAFPKGHARRGMGAITAGWVEKRLIVRVPEQLVAHGRQHVVRIIVADIKRQVAINALDRARLDKSACATAADAVIERFRSELLDQVAHLWRRRLGLLSAIIVP